MTGAQQGLLMLTCRLGDHSTVPLTARQFQGLRARMQRLECPCDKDMTQSDLRAIGIPSELAQRILALLDRQTRLEDYLAAAYARDICPVTRLDGNYPRILEHKLGKDAPAVLFCRGNTDIFSIPCVSVVGSRDIRPENLRFAQTVGAVAAREGYAVSSGGARGADLAAQRACLENRGFVIQFSPDRLDKLSQRDNILFCSLEGWELNFSTQRALERNRLIHAMGEKTFVAQCDAGHGGSWRGAEENLRRGYSTVFVYWDGSAGAADLLRKGAVEVSELSSIAQLHVEQNSFWTE